MARPLRGILVFLAGFSLLMVNATEEKALTDKDLVVKHAESGQESKELFHVVAADQELSGKDSIAFDGQ